MFLRVDRGRDTLVGVKRRRFITFGSILAMALALAAGAYLVWFAVWHAPESGPSNELVNWSDGIDTVTLLDGSKLFFGLSITRACQTCGIRHAFWVACVPAVQGSMLYGHRVISFPEFNRFGKPLWGSIIYEFGGNKTSVTWLAIRFSDWLPIPLLAAYPALYFLVVGLRRFRRRRANHCMHCDYDLKGNVSGVCSECGMAVTTGSRSDDAGNVN